MIRRNFWQNLKKFCTWDSEPQKIFENIEINLKKKRLYNEHYPNILVTFLGETEHFSGRIGALRWSILVGNKSTMYKSLFARAVHSNESTTSGRWGEATCDVV